MTLLFIVYYGWCGEVERNVRLLESISGFQLWIPAVIWVPDWMNY